MSACTRHRVALSSGSISVSANPGNRWRRRAFDLLLAGLASLSLSACGDPIETGLVRALHAALNEP